MGKHDSGKTARKSDYKGKHHQTEHPHVLPGSRDPYRASKAVRDANKANESATAALRRKLFGGK